MLQALTGVPTLAVLPMWREHGLPEEDGVFEARPSGAGLSVAVVAYPYLSNLDEFAPLRRVPGVSLSWARQRSAIAAADLLVLPGSKNVAADLVWLREGGLDGAIAAHVAAGKPALAICGGLQMLGGEIRDPHAVEGRAQGLGLLPYSTEFQQQKHYRRATHTFAPLTGFWAPLSGISLEAYEIHHGLTRPTGPAAFATLPLEAALPGHCGWQHGQTLAIYVHGIFESPAVLRGLFGQNTPTLDDTFNGLADFIDAHFEPGVLMSLLK
jgi:adenosylcobyric acid synthase